MKLLKPFLPVFAWSALFLSLACTKKDTRNDQPAKLPPPVIHAVIPNSGAYHSIIIITGANFNIDSPQHNIVKFNGSLATIQKVSADSLVVIVPTAAGTGNVSVAVDGVSVTGPLFTYTWTTMVSTAAGMAFGHPGETMFSGFKDGPDSIAQFQRPIGIALGPGGILYVADMMNNRIRKIENGMVSTLAGNTESGFLNGSVATAQFWSPSQLAVDTMSNTVYVSDMSNHCIRKISAGQVTTYAGSGIIGFTNGRADTAAFYGMNGIAFDTQGNLYVADDGNSCIRKVSAAGIVTTIAGDGTRGFAEGPPSTARFSNPIGIVVDVSGNIYVADQVNKRVRKITPAGVTTTLAGTGVQGFADGPGNAAQFQSPTGIALDTAGNIYVSDFCRIREISPDGTVKTLAGTTVRGYADGPADSAQFYYPEGLVFDTHGDLYVVDGANHRIRKIFRQ
jgi:sugar lactone lactonase YvrE